MTQSQRERVLSVYLVVETGPDMKVALLHNTPAAFHGRPELAQQLTSELTDALRIGQIVTSGA